MSVVALAPKDFSEPPPPSTPSSSSSSSSSQHQHQQQQQLVEDCLPGSIHQTSDGDDFDEGEEEEEDQGDTTTLAVDLGPILPLKQQLELDKEDESLRRWKEQLLCNLHLDENDMEPQVKVLTLGIAAEGRPTVNISLPSTTGSKLSHAFTLKEGSCYRLFFTFMVSHNIVSGLTYVNTVWKSGLRVDHTRTMLGTYGPQADPYTHFTEEEITPSGLLARGSYSARTKFLDDDKRCYLEFDYTFDIRKDWAH